MPAAGCYVRVSTTLDPGANERVRTLASALAARRPNGVREIYPGYGSIYLEWDDAALGRPTVEAWIDSAVSAPSDSATAAPTGRQVSVPVRWDGPDLADVLARTGLTTETFAAVVAGTDYRVYAVGAGPGQPLLGSVGPALDAPRLASPRGLVESLSVGLAGRQATIYPVPMPGGFRLIGTALATIYDPHLADPALFAHGDRVRFEAASGEPPAAPEPLALLPAEARRPALRVEEPGALDLVLDEGRIGAAQIGLAQSGPLDAGSARLANALVGNPPDAALLELTLTGPTLTTLAPISVALTGAGMRLDVDGSNASGRTTRIGRGATLRIRPSGIGVRGYLAVGGGIEVRRHRGSSSTDLRGLIGRPLASGDVLGLAGPATGWSGVARPRRASGETVVIRLRRGPQWSGLAARALESNAFVLSAADRTGVRLSGADVPGGELLSESPPLGAVQVPTSGAPIVLLADRLRSAGYAKPALVHPADLSRFGQLREGASIRFRFVDEAPHVWIRDV